MDAVELFPQCVILTGYDERYKFTYTELFDKDNGYMSDYDDFQLDEETLRQIEEEAMREAIAEVEADKELLRRIEEEALSITSIAADPSFVRDDFQSKDNRVKYLNGDDDEMVRNVRRAARKKAKKKALAKKRLDIASHVREYRSKEIKPGHVNIEMIKQDIQKKSGTIKIAIICVTFMIIVACVAAYLIIHGSKSNERQNDSNTNVGAHDNPKLHSVERKRDDEATKLRKEISRIAMSRHVIASDVMDALDMMNTLKENYPDYCKRNATIIKTMANSLAKKKKKVEDMQKDFGRP